jgi:hypothetical protein
MAAGVYGDHRGWWEHRSFLTNLVSSLASVMFGIPTALLILGHLSNAQAEALQKQQVRRRARREIEAFRHVLLRAFSATDLASLRAQTTGLDTAVLEMDRVPSPQWGEYGQARETAEAWVDRIRPLEDTYQQAFADMVSSITGPQSGSWLDDLQAHWEDLDQGLRFQAVEADQHWLTPPRMTEMRRVWVDLRSGGDIGAPLDLDIANWPSRDTDRHTPPHEVYVQGVSRIEGAIRRRRTWLAALGVVLEAADELAGLY